MDIYGIGTDVVECLRIAKMIERHGEKFISRIYTDHEIQCCRSKPSATQYYAAYWAAKEAILKSIGIQWENGIQWRDIEVFQGSDSKLTVRLAGRAKMICEEKRITEIFISFSHCRTHATSFATAVRNEVPF